ncbi:MAG: AAA family ATPase [Treponema sp.]|nr:AAA family ATPase [Treponema sp.]
MTKIDTAGLEYVLKVTPPEQNVMLVGRHGIGKSQILEKYFTSQGIRVVTLFLGQMSDPGDLIGLPEKNLATGKTEFLLPYWFPTDNEPIVLFLDELNRARPEVLQTIMDLTLNRRLAGKALPAGSRVISAVNSGDQYTLTELDPALVSRFNVYEFTPTVSEWLVWAEKSGIDQRIIDFISENNNLLDGLEFDKTIFGLERTPDRRSWERLSNVMKNMSGMGNQDLNVISGIIGAAAASRFFAAISQNKYITANEVLNAANFMTSVRPYLLKYKVPEIAVINEGIFRILDVHNYPDVEEDKILANLQLYFSTINNLKSKEVMAHFTNLFTSAAYPHAVVTIATKCQKTIYAGIKNFISELGN